MSAGLNTSGMWLEGRDGEAEREVLPGPVGNDMHGRMHACCHAFEDVQSVGPLLEPRLRQKAIVADSCAHNEGSGPPVVLSKHMRYRGVAAAAAVGTVGVPRIFMTQRYDSSRARMTVELPAYTICVESSCRYLTSDLLTS